MLWQRGIRLKRKLSPGNRSAKQDAYLHLLLGPSDGIAEVAECDAQVLVAMGNDARSLGAGTLQQFEEFSTWFEPFKRLHKETA